jgi:hypothetical protein
MDRQIADAAQRLYADALVMSREDRLTRLQALDGLARARGRIAGAIAVVVPARQYRRSIDPVHTFTDALRGAGPAWSCAIRRDQSAQPGYAGGGAARNEQWTPCTAKINGI